MNLTRLTFHIMRIWLTPHPTYEDPTTKPSFEKFPALTVDECRALPFPMMLGSVDALGGGVGDRGPSLGRAPFTCFSRSIFMCSIQRRGRPTLRLAWRVSMAAVAVETVESMMGACSHSHSSSATSSSSSFSPSSSSPSPGKRPALTASWTPPLGWVLMGDWSLLHVDWPPGLGWDAWECQQESKWLLYYMFTFSFFFFFT